jgi:DNA-binding transcriptional LysR family regulator
MYSIALHCIRVDTLLQAGAKAGFLGEDPSTAPYNLEFSNPAEGPGCSPKPMELMQLQMLVAVAEEGSLQEAAARVYRTASAVSIAISKLEREVGVVLLDRAHGRAFRLTAAGEVLVDYGRRLISLRDEALAAVDGIRSVEQGQLRIGANQSIGEYLLPQLSKAFQARYPGVKLKIVIGYSDAILSALKRQELDVALVAGQPQDGDLRGHLLVRDRLIAVMSPRQRLASREVLHIQDLASEPLIVLTATSELRERVAKTFQRFRVPMNVQVETATLESIKRMAAEDIGVGIVPRMCVEEEATNGQLVARTIDEFCEERMLWMVCRRTTTLSPPCRAFMKVTKSEFGALSKKDGRDASSPRISRQRPRGRGP